MGWGRTQSATEQERRAIMIIDGKGIKSQRDGLSLENLRISVTY